MLEKISYWITIIGFPILIGTMIATFLQIHEIDRAVASQNNIALNTEFFNNVDTGIIDAIENNKSILIEHGGKYTDAQLDNYLGNFDTIDDAYSEGLLTESDLCDSFSYYIVSTSDNAEIQQYMKEYPHFFGGLLELEDTIKNSRNSNCH